VQKREGKESVSAFCAVCKKAFRPNPAPLSKVFRAAAFALQQPQARARRALSTAAVPPHTWRRARGAREQRRARVSVGACRSSACRPARKSGRRRRRDTHPCAVHRLGHRPARRALAVAAHDAGPHAGALLRGAAFVNDARLAQQAVETPAPVARQRACRRLRRSARSRCAAGARRMARGACRSHGAVRAHGLARWPARAHAQVPGANEPAGGERTWKPGPHSLEQGLHPSRPVERQRSSEPVPVGIMPPKKRKHTKAITCHARTQKPSERRNRKASTHAAKRPNTRSAVAPGPAQHARARSVQPARRRSQRGRRSPALAGPTAVPL
jgi:hypothetical protein